MKHKFSRYSEVIGTEYVAIRCDRCHLAVNYSHQRREECNVEPPTATAVQYGVIEVPSLSVIDRLDKLEPQVVDHERRLNGNRDRVNDLAQGHLHDIAELRREVAEMRTELNRDQKYHASMSLRVAQLEAWRRMADPSPRTY